LVIAGRQVLTQFFWEHLRDKYKLYVSQAVLNECSDGDLNAAQRRLDLIKDVESLPKPEGLEELADAYQALLDIPDRAKADCTHLAYCVLYRIDVLLTWNCGHLGPTAQEKIRVYNHEHDLWTPQLVTPEVLTIKP
jgi:hypothetical protein